MSIGAAAAEEAGPGSLAPTGYLWSLLQMLGALLLVCLLAYLLLRGLRRLADQRGSSGTMRVLDRCPLSPRHSLWIVEVADRCFLLGCSDSRVTRLAELDRDSVHVSAPKPPPRSFRDILAGLGSKRAAP